MMNKPTVSEEYVCNQTNYTHKMEINVFSLLRHIMEHLAGTADFDLENATPEELEFHFFK